MVEEFRVYGGGCRVTDYRGIWWGSVGYMVGECRVYGGGVGVYGGVV